MQLTVTFKNLDPSESLKSYVKGKLDRFDKLLDNPAEASVMLSVEKFRHIAEINITGDRLNINGKEETNDMYSAIDMVLDKIESQIKKNKEKIRERRSGGKSQVMTMMSDDIFAADDDDAKQSIPGKPSAEALGQKTQTQNRPRAYSERWEILPQEHPGGESHVLGR